jgi:hypothetical protein
MAECSRCKVETQLHINGIPVCPDCDDPAIRSQERQAGRELAKAAYSTRHSVEIPGSTDGAGEEGQ